jgi:hypothetical protein
VPYVGMDSDILHMLIVCGSKLYLRNANLRWNLNRLAIRRNSEAVNYDYEFVKSVITRKVRTFI